MDVCHCLPTTANGVGATHRGAFPSPLRDQVLASGLLPPTPMYADNQWAISALSPNHLEAICVVVVFWGRHFSPFVGLGR